jgi:hypothetical protein
MVFAEKTFHCFGFGPLGNAGGRRVAGLRDPVLALQPLVLGVRRNRLKAECMVYAATPLFEVQ